jgi:hypothetical protein
MKKILALALLTLRSALNSRIVLILGILLTLILSLFPLHLQGDGTAPGRIRILLEYTLNALVVILSFSIAWTACCAVAREAADRQLQLVLTKPVTRLQIWLGKWIGLVALHAAFLFVGGLVLYLILLGSLPSSTSPTTDKNWEWAHYEILHPQAESIGPALERRVEEARQSLLIPRRKGPPSQRELKYFALEIRRSLATLPPTAHFLWTFQLPPEAGTPAAPLRLRYRFSASRWENNPIPLEWRIQRDSQTPAIAIQQTAVAEQIWELPLPREVRDGTGPLHITGVNLATNPPTTLVFEPDQSVHLLVTHRDNGINYLRGLFVLLARLAFFAAVGLTAGCLFSTPTALFFTLFTLILLSLGTSIREVAETGVLVSSHHAEGVGAGVIETPVLVVHRVVNRLLAPVRSLNVIPRLGGQERISWAEVGHAWRIYVAIWGGTMLLAGLGALRRREFGKPENL